MFVRIHDKTFSAFKSTKFSSVHLAHLNVRWELRATQDDTPSAAVMDLEDGVQGAIIRETINRVRGQKRRSFIWSRVKVRNRIPPWRDTALMDWGDKGHTATLFLRPVWKLSIKQQHFVLTRSNFFSRELGLVRRCRF